MGLAGIEPATSALSVLLAPPVGAATPTEYSRSPAALLSAATPEMASVGVILGAHGGAVGAQALRLRSAAPRVLHPPPPSHIRLANYASGVLLCLYARGRRTPALPALAGLATRSVAAKVVDGIEYLREHGRGAVLPDVRHRRQTSRHFPDMSEVRADQLVGGRRFVMRVLVCFVDEDQTLLVCIGGNKDRYPERVDRDWYDDYVPAADRVVDSYKKGALR